MTDDTLSRRLFIQGSAAAGALMWSMAARAAEGDAVTGPPATLGVIGTGAWGKQILRALARFDGARVAAICDTSEPALKSAAEIAPQAAAVDEAGKLLANKDVQGVVIATPTHRHKDLVLAALAAGKHVYCETPLAHTIDDAKAIAKAAAGTQLIFQSGLLHRTNPLTQHAVKLHRAGNIGDAVAARAQWHRRESWLKGAAGADPQRLRELNWRLYHDSSPGLVAEVGTSQIDFVTWLMKKKPVKVSGTGGVLAWREDGREVADTIRCTFEYPNGLQFTYDATLGNSFDGVYEQIQGLQGTFVTKETRAWMFKESDAALQGWEVYARQEKVGDEQGVVMVANSTKLLEAGEEPSKHANEDKNGALYYALEAFCNAIRTPGESACDAQKGYEATVVALTANEAIRKGTTIELDPAWFSLD